MTVYAIAQGSITDRDAFNLYLEKSGPTLLAYGVRLLAVDETPTAEEGELDHPRTVILSCESAEAFYRWYDSPEYQDITHLRKDNTEGTLVCVDEFVMPG